MKNINRIDGITSEVAMKCFSGFAIAVAGFAGAAGTVAAQTIDVGAVMRTIPQEGRTAKDLIPQGWELYQEAKGDLNGDRIADIALTVALPADEADRLKESKNYRGAPNIVIVAFGKRGGSFTRFAVNGKLYPDDGDSRSYMSPTIKNGVLILNNNWGDVMATDVTYRFRYDAATKKLMLIGFDFEEYSRTNDHDGSRSSENYVTGIAVMYAKFPWSKSHAFQEIKRVDIAPAKVTFEETVVGSKEYARAPF